MLATVFDVIFAYWYLYSMGTFQGFSNRTFHLIVVCVCWKFVGRPLLGTVFNAAPENAAS